VRSVTRREYDDKAGAPTDPQRRHNRVGREPDAVFDLSGGRCGFSRAGAPTVAELTAAGAVRISLGSAIAQAACAVAARATTELLADGTCKTTAHGIPYDRINDALASIR